MAPIGPVPPVAPRFFYFDFDRPDREDVRLRVSPRVRIEVRNATGKAMQRLIELREQTRSRVRVQMDDTPESMTPPADEGVPIQR